MLLNRHKERVRKLLTSEEGLIHRSKRPIEVELVFGQTKSNKGYNRFGHFGKDGKEKVMMDFGIFAVAFNIGKPYNKSIKNTQNTQNTQKSTVSIHTPVFFIIFVPKSDFYLSGRYFYSLNLNLAA